MGVFEFIIAIVVISTIGKIITERGGKVPAPKDRPSLEPGEADMVRQSLDELSSRVGRLEEERDFYKQLLESPEAKRQLREPDGQQ